MKVIVPGMEEQPVNEVYGSVHMDTQPMVLVHTTGLSTPGQARIRKWAKYKKGFIIKRKYVLNQPHVHAIYRAGFSAVDIFNKMSLGPNSIQKAYKTKQWTHRMFLAFLSFAVTNAYLCHKHRNKSNGTKWLEFSDWKEELVWAMFKHAKRESAKDRTRTKQQDVPGALLTRFGLKCTDLTKHPKRTNPHCAICKVKRTSFYCTTCGPGYPICNSMDNSDCRLVHMICQNTKDKWQKVQQRV